MSKHLIIVESPTKAKTITKFLGKDYTVLSSFGHIRDLPKSKMGVDVEHNFEPTYVVPTKSKKHVIELKKAAKEAEDIVLATDSDREGEAIAWHISELLNLKPAAIKRIVFHEITKSAIEHALENPRALDNKLVDAQQTRRILDRLVGYELSPLLWQKVRRGLSAGRVQSVALRFIVERERERNAFEKQEYWTVETLFNKDNVSFPGKLNEKDGKKMDKLAIKNEPEAQAIKQELADADYSVADVQKKDLKKTPPPPFTTSTLQMEANNKLGMSAKQTMMLAQGLYETGRITYMRTDSVNLAETFLQQTQSYLKNTFGEQYAKGANVYKTKQKGAQEAHEAIRPTDIELTPESLYGVDPRATKLYKLIWQRALASQMPPAKLERTTIDTKAKQYVFRSTGNTVKFDGYLRVYQSAKEQLLPVCQIGDQLICEELKIEQHETEPPPRYSDASLVKALEADEIGRPSTYAPTISTLLDREYVDRDDNKKLFPTDIGLIVNDVLVEHFPNIVDKTFTAKMENELDCVADGKCEWVALLKDFYEPFHQTIEEKKKTITREDITKEKELGIDPESGKAVFVKTGRFGPYVQLGPDPDKDDKDAVKPRRTSLTKNLSMETVNLAEALELLSLPRLVGQMENGDDIMADLGRFGPYLKAGKITASLTDEFPPQSVSLTDARRLLIESAEKKKRSAEPLAEFGADPTTKKPILLKDGRYGPYVTDGKTNASVPKKIDPATLTREQALELLEKKRTRPPRAFGKKKKTE